MQEDERSDWVPVKDTMLKDRQSFFVMISDVTYMYPEEDLEDIHGVSELMSEFDISINDFEHVSTLHKKLPVLVETLTTIEHDVNVDQQYQQEVLHM